MTDEDLLAAKLKGYSCLIKFNDGEELCIKVPDVLSSEDESVCWFEFAESYINGHEEVEFFPVAGFAMSRSAIKYIKKI